jgi:alkaline phosphatase D
MNMSDNEPSNITVTRFVELYSHETEAYVNSSKALVCVNWLIAVENTMAPVADSGTAYTSSNIDFTVKVETLFWAYSRSIHFD